LNFPFFDNASKTSGGDGGIVAASEQRIAENATAVAHFFSALFVTSSETFR
jgi:hypothetical protein